MEVEPDALQPAPSSTGSKPVLLGMPLLELRATTAPQPAAAAEEPAAAPRRTPRRGLSLRRATEEEVSHLVELRMVELEACQRSWFGCRVTQVACARPHSGAAR